jgi:mannose-1-phosphate guanylyltransferase
MKALVLAAGFGTRLQPLTATVPKALVPIGGVPLLDSWAEALGRAGVRRCRINTHHLRERMAEHLERLNASGPVHWEESYEPELLGSAGTVTRHRDWVADGETCLIVYADNFSTLDLRGLAAFHRSRRSPLTIALFHAPEPRDCGIVELSGDQRVVSFTEKPERPASDLAFAGVLAVEAEAYREIADRQAFDLGRDILPLWVGRMLGWTWEGYHRDIGTPEALEEVREHVRRGSP